MLSQRVFVSSCPAMSCTGVCYHKSVISSILCNLAEALVTHRGPSNLPALISAFPLILVWKGIFLRNL